MKVLLVALCVVTGLFGGGCALMAGSLGTPAVPLTLIPGTVFLFNLLVIIAVVGWGNPWKPAFYTLAVVDYLIAAAVLVSLLAASISGGAQDILAWAILMGGAFALKGWLTWNYIRGV
jgi:hypothetical protein